MKRFLLISILVGIGLVLGPVSANAFREPTIKDEIYSSKWRNDKVSGASRRVLYTKFEAIAAAAAPVDATYITEIANGTLTNEFALGSLTTGALWNTTTTGVPSIAATLTSLEGLTIANGTLIYGIGADALAALTAGTANYLLQANGAAAPSWATDVTLTDVTISNLLRLGTTPTVGSFETGKVYYDATNKTVSAMINADVTLQIGQEDLMYAKNASGVDITNGQAVYLSGADSGFPTITLAKADSFATSVVTAVATQDVANGASGLVTRRGRIHGLDTDVAEGWSAGDILYLSSTTVGGLTNVVPGIGDIESRVARVITVDNTAGIIYVDLFRTLRLTDLSNVTTDASPAIDDILKYNGASWINGSGITVSGASGVTFYPNGTNILPIDSENLYEVNSLLKTPAGGAEEVDIITVLSNTVMGEAYLFNTAIGTTKIDAGQWTFDIYASTSSIGGGSTSSLTGNIYHVVTETATITTTGSGTSRTATASGGTPFANDDDNADITLSGYIQTPQGLYQITGYTSATVVTIATPTGYGNETTAAFSTWKRKFGGSTGTITNLLTNFGLYSSTFIQPEIVIAITDKIGGIIFGTSTHNRSLRFVYNGTEHYSRFSSPLLTKHNDLAGLNGGSTGEYYHMTSAEYTGTGTGAFVRTTAPTFATSIDVTGGGDIDADGADLDTGNDYQINNTSVLNATTLGGAVLGSSLTSLGTIASLVATTADINAGTFDGVIGGTTPAAGSFVALDSSNVTDLNIPNMSAAAGGFEDSPLTTDGTDVDCAGATSSTSYTADPIEDPVVFYDALDAQDTDWWTGTNADAGATSNDAWEIRTSATPGANVGLSVDYTLNSAKLRTSGDSPGLTNCGTTPAIIGSDANGKITIGTGATTSCTVTFDSTFTAAPACVISGDNNAIGYATTTSATVLTITSSGDMDSDVISYICVGML